MTTPRWIWTCVALLGLSVSAAVDAAVAGAAVILDDFETIEGWTAHPAEEVDLAISSDAGASGRGMRLDFRFRKGSGYAVAHKDLSIDLPENYAFTFRLRGAAAPNHLEFKLIDSTGANVWWFVRRDLRFPRAWELYRTKKRQISFAWGPRGGGDIHHVAAIEFAITAGSGGSGSVWIDDLEMVPLPPASAAAPALAASATSWGVGGEAARAVDGDSATAWSSGRGDREPALTIDLGEDREYGGLVVDWRDGRHPRRYAIEASDDGSAWRELRRVQETNGGRDYHLLTESESRYLRIRATSGSPRDGISIREVTVEPLEWGASLESFYRAIAGDAPRGSYPRAIRGEQTFWTVVGDDAGDREEGLLSEDGMLETGKGRFSIEPFLRIGDRFVTWSDVCVERRRVEGGVPIPAVRWVDRDLTLDISAFATDAWTAARLLGRGDTARAGGLHLVARYRLRNAGIAHLRATLYLAIRPFQVNPPAQFLNTRGGTAPIRALSRDGLVIRVNGDRGLTSLSTPLAFGATAFDSGDIVADDLRFDRIPRRSSVADPFGKASGALAYDLDLPAGDEREVDILIPLHGRPMPPRGGRLPVAAAEDQCRERWRARRRGIEITVPDSARDVIDTMWSQLAYILVNRDGAAIQPGSRSYERSWIRDGALTSSALLRLGQADVVRDYIEWFAPNQYPSGKIPCVVDARGPDPVPEHDSSGEFIFLVAEYDRYVHDRAFLERMWPHVVRAVAYLDSLRRVERVPSTLAPGTRSFYGILPPSISHEGYSAKPMHSYWDDLFALRGFRDAAMIAGELGLEGERERIGAIRDEFASDLRASVETAIAAHGIDFIPGCADLGDFDATSTTIAFDPVGAQDVLPELPLRRTFEKYWEFFVGRRDGPQTWDAFTPYEIRNVGAFVELGWRDRAQDLLRYFLDHRVPAEWEQWPEVVWRDAREPKFIGDLPHTWVGSDYVRAVIDMLVYTREPDGALVVGAGVPFAWIEAPAGLDVRGLPTPFGELSFSMRAGADSCVIRLEAGPRIPPAGIAVLAPIRGRLRTATVDAAQVPVGPSGEVIVRSLPSTVVVRF